MTSYDQRIMGYYKSTSAPLLGMSSLRPRISAPDLSTTHHDITKFLSVLFQGKICIYIDKIKNKQTLLPRLVAEEYLGNYYPIKLWNPFDADGHLCEHIDSNEIIKWFEAEDGFSKFEFRCPMSKKEEDERIQNIYASLKFYNVSGSSSFSSSGGFFGPVSGTNVTLANP